MGYGSAFQHSRPGSIGGQANLNDEEYALLKEINAGKILYAIWGYSMTIVDFYQIVKETEKTVVVRKLKSVEEHTGFLSGKCMASLTPDLENDGTEKHIRAYKRNFNNETTYIYREGGVKMYLHRWDGKPRSFNHCD